MKNKKIYKYNLFLILGLIALLMVQCIDDEPELRSLNPEEMQIMEYVEADSVNYTEFFNITEYIGMSGILSTRGPFTLFLPDDTAFKAYYESKGKSSFFDFTVDELTKIIRNHVVAIEIYSADIGLGSLSEKNAIGDYLVSEFSGSEIIINKYSRIIDRDVIVANGVIHKVDKVIDPVIKGTFSVIKDLPEFSIFTNGLELAGLKDTLEMLEIPYGVSTARVRYTILAVPDSVFNANGIYSVEDLVTKYDDGLGNINQEDNGFYEYMVYHCLENTYYLSTIETGTYYLISRNNSLYIEAENDYYINPTEEGDTTKFIERYSNIPCKNGVIHGINKLLPAIKPEPREYNFDTTSFPEFEAMDIYGGDGGVRNFYDGENGFAKIKWTGDFMQYWCKFQGTGFINDDCIVMSDGYWTLEITMPKITRGKYKVFGYFKKGSNRANVVFYFDGVKADNVIELNNSSQSYDEIEICEVDWKTTEEHVVKVVTVYPGIIMWDRLTFRPI